MRNKILIGIIIASLLIGAGTLRRGHEWGDDFAWYILQAKSFFNGTVDEFMKQSEFTNTQSSAIIGPLAYPWGYPLILIPVYALKEISPLGMKLPGLFFYAGFLTCFYILTKNRLTRTESLIIVSLFAFNPLLIQFEDQILSDIPFLFFSTLALTLMTQENKNSWVQNSLIGMVIFLTTFIRTTGVLLLVAFLIVESFNLQKRIKDRNATKQILLKMFTVCFTFGLMWAFKSLIFPNGEGSYFSQYTGLSLEKIRVFAYSYFNVFSTFFGQTNSWKYLYYVLVPFFLLGAWARRKQESFFIYFTVLWMAVHITWPYWQGPRFIFPILPIYIYFTFWGVKTAITRLPAKYQIAGINLHYGLWILVAGIFLFTTSANALTNLQGNRAIGGPFDPFSIEMYDYIKEKTPTDSVIVFFKPRVMVLMTGHNAIMSTECDRILLGDYLALSRKVGGNQQIPPEEIKSCGLPLEQVLKNQRFVLYKILK